MMSKKPKYNLDASVTWREITGMLRWRIGVLSRDAMHYVRCCSCDEKHNMMDFFPYHRYRALMEAEKVFSVVRLLNELRVFLKYKPLLPSDLGLDELVAFYDLHFWDAQEVGIVTPPRNTPYFYPE